MGNYPVSPLQGDLTGELKLSDYLTIALRRRWWIILCAVGVLTATIVVVRRLPNIYKGETTILVDPQQVPNNYVPTTVTANVGDRLTTLKQQVLSPTRLKKLVESEHLYPEPTGRLSEEDVIKSLQKSIAVDVDVPGGPKMGAFKIAYIGRQREQVAPIANKLAEMFIEENSRARVEQTQETADFLDSQLQEAKRQLDDKDGRLQSIKSHNILDLPESKPYHLEALAGLRAQAQAIEDKIAQDQREKSLYQSMLATDAAPPTVDVDGNQGDTPASPEEAQIQKLETQLTDLRARYGPAHPDVRRVAAELKKLQDGRTPEVKGAAPRVSLQPAIPTTPSRRNPVIEAQIEQLSDDIKDRTNQLEPIQANIDMHSQKLEQIPVFEQQLARLQQEYDVVKAQYTALLDKKMAAEMSNALEVHQKGERFVILDTAVKPSSPVSPNRLAISLAGLVGGLLCGVAAAALVEMTDESLRSEKEAAQIFGKPVLSAIPYVAPAKELWVRRFQAAGMITGTVAGSAALGFAFSMVAGRLM